MILGSTHRPVSPDRSADVRGQVLRVSALVLGILAVLAAVMTVAAVVTRSGGTAASGHPTAASSPAGSAAEPPAASRPPATRPSIKPYPEASTADPAGGIAGARARVGEFVAALNSGDMDRANSLLCRSMFGRYDASSLAGIKPGSLGVGGVTVQGNSGSAIVTYLPDGGGPEERSLFGLTVEHDAWMLCTPQ